ncbi:MAG: T9SS type A sorting domain-containing protein [Bacteroidota bacterium]
MNLFLPAKPLNLSIKILSFICMVFLTKPTVYAQAGTLDPTFTPGTAASNRLSNIVFQSDGKPIIIGDFTSYNGTSRNRIARLNTNGTIDPTFNVGTGFNASPVGLAIQSDGKILCGGNFTSYNSVPIARIVRINSDGTRDTTFTPGTGANGFVYSIGLQSNGKIVICGAFTTYNGVAANGVALLNTDGTLDATFNTNTGTGFNIYSYHLTVQSDDKIIIGGNFGTFNGVARNKIARLNADGTLDATFVVGSGANSLVYATAIQPDGKILIGGNFSSYNGTPRTRLARLNSNGSIDPTFSFTGTGINNIVFAISLTSDSKVIIGGQFTAYNGISRARIACLNTDGSLNTTFVPLWGANNIVYTTAIQNDQNILIGGTFTLYDSTSANRIARLKAVCLNASAPTVSASTSSVCAGQSTTLSISSGTLNDASNWQWYSSSCAGIAEGAGTSIVVSPTTTTVYYVRGEGACTTPTACTSITITVNSLPTPTITGGTGICNGAPVTLNAGSFTSYLWSTGATSSTITTSTPGQYSVTVTDINGCSASTSISISSNNNSIIPGPGGVGSSVNTELWLDASSLALTNGSAVQTWTDRSGNTKNATQATLINRPAFLTNQLNNLPVIDFDGTNDYVTTPAIPDVNTANLSWFVVAAADNNTHTGMIINSKYTSGAGTKGSASLWGTLISSTGTYGSFTRNSAGTYIDIPHAYAPNYRILSNVWNGNTDIINGYRDGVLTSAKTGADATPVTNNYLRLGANSSGATSPFNGKIAEAIVFSTTLNEAERIIVENYLATKYNLTTALDIYGFESTHSFEAAGIGQRLGSSQVSSKGNIVEMSQPSALSNDDFLMWAHNNASTSSNNTDVPVAYGVSGKRMQRTWRVDKTNDVGTVTLKFYLSGIASGGSSNLELLIDNDGTFTDASRITSGFNYDNVCQVATFTNVNFSDGQYFTIGTPDGTALLRTANDEGGLEILTAKENEITVYPNPNNGEFNLFINEISEDMVVEVYNSVGQVVLKQNIDQNQTVLNINGETSGIYFIKISGNNATGLMTKIIKQ